MRKRAVSLTNWKRYLDYENNSKLIPFIKSRGNEVFWQICQNVRKYHLSGISSLTMIIHENAPYAINIPRAEYFEVMNYALRFFEKKEDYKKCQSIIEWLDSMEEYNKRKRNKKVERQNKLI